MPIRFKAHARFRPGPARPGTSVVPSGSSSLLTDLVGYWKLDEASGTRNDSHTNALHLTDNNTVGQGAGKIGDAADFIPANSENLSRAISVLTRPSLSGFHVACWIRPDTVAAGDRVAMSMDGGAHGGRQYSLLVSSARPILYVFNAAGGNVSATWSADLVADGTWYFVEGWWDPADSKVRVAVNGAAAVASAGTITPDAEDQVFEIGGNTTSGFFDGRIDEAGYWNGRILTAAERAHLYNAGAGRTYPFAA